MTAPYFLYRSQASYHTAKTRSCLRKKGISFVDRISSHRRSPRNSPIGDDAIRCRSG